ncbi:STAS domain-containing protein [Dongshaea marina]|uniref:STAS domain-containing protein n=1 Tax=Dongshaea marina TaxID=2047966 RepID=UPI000D3E26AB|nr:STAS domain-containing protein [Dongshaea marina]
MTDRIELPAILTREAIPGLWSQPWAECVSMDLRQVTELDSAGVGFLVHWAAERRRRNCSATVIGGPETFDNLTAIYGVSELFSRQSD